MNADWLLISCLVSGVIGLVILFVLGAFWLADRSDEQAQRVERDYANRVVRHGDQHPWMDR